MSAGWPDFDAVLATLSTAPSRTGSVISTIYGDAILPRGGSLALADLLAVMRRLDATEGVVRTAVSRLARDGVLVGRRTGRTSAYALSPASRDEFQQAVPLIYGALDRDWDGRLRLAFPDRPEQRLELQTRGYAALVASVMIGVDPAPDDVVCLWANGTADHQCALAERAWPLATLDIQYGRFIQLFSKLSQAPSPLDALGARIALIHQYRRLALRTPRLPAELMAPDWLGTAARQLCIQRYTEWAPAAEAWLDQASDGSGPLPRGPDPLLRFSGGDRRPSATASSPAPAGSRRPGPPAPR